MIKNQWLASIGCQNDQNKSKSKLQKWSKSNDLHRFDVKTIRNVELRRKTFKHNAKLQNQSNYNNLHRLDVKTMKTKLKLNYKSDQNPMTCIDLTLKRSKMLSYVAKHSKQHKTTKPIKLQWIASSGCQNDQNKAKLQMWSKFNDLHRLDVKTIKTKLKLNYKSDQNPMTCIDLTSKRSKMLSYVAKHSNTTQTYKTNQITMNCIDWMSKRSKQS